MEIAKLDSLKLIWRETLIIFVWTMFLVNYDPWPAINQFFFPGGSKNQSRISILENYNCYGVLKLITLKIYRQYFMMLALSVKNTYFLFLGYTFYSLNIQVCSIRDEDSHLIQGIGLSAIWHGGCLFIKWVNIWLK